MPGCKMKEIIILLLLRKDALGEWLGGYFGSHFVLGLAQMIILKKCSVWSWPRCSSQWPQPWVPNMSHTWTGREALALPLSRVVISLVFSVFCPGKWCLPVFCLCLSWEMNEVFLFPRKKLNFLEGSSCSPGSQWNPPLFPNHSLFSLSSHFLGDNSPLLA